MRLSTLIIVAAACSIFFQSHAQQFPCDGKLYFFRNDNGANWLSYVDQYTTGSPVVADVCKLTVTGQNAMGANPVDHFIYFTANPNQTLYRMDANCNTTAVCSGLVPSTDKGCFDNQGRYWIIDNSNYLRAYNLTTCTQVKGPYLLSSIYGVDLVFSAADCHFYMADDSHVIQVDTNGVQTASYSSGFGGTGSFGGFAIGSDGNLYGIPNGTTTGQLYGFNLATHTSMGLVYSFPNGTANPCGCDMASFPCPSLKSNFTATPNKGCGIPFTVNFNNLSSGLVNTFTWDFGDGSKDSSTFNPSHNYMQAGTYTANLIVNALSKCLFIPPDSFSVTIQVFPLPVVAISGNASLCLGQSISLTASGGVSYKWSTGETTSSITVSPLSDTTYSVTATDTNSCSASDTQAVIVNQLPVVSISGNTMLCLGQSTSLTASGGTSYLWSTGETTSSITVLPTADTSYSVTATDANRCSATIDSAVSVFPLPNVSFAPFSNSVCVNDPSFTLTGGSPLGGTYSGTGVSGNMFDPSTAGVGTYTLTYSFTDIHGCSSSAITSITVDAAGTVTLAALPSLCTTSSPVTLVGNPTGGTFSGTGVSGNTFDPSLSGPGTFTITYSYTGGHCFANTSDSIVVSVSSGPVVTISASPTIGCVNHTIYLGYGPQNVTLTANSGSIITAYQWYVNSSPIPGATSSSISVSAAGDYNVAVTDAAGCQSNPANTTSLAISVVDVRCGHNMDKVVLCHVPPGNSGNPQTLCIAPSAVPAHLANHPGDCLGPCPFSKRVAETAFGAVSENGTEFSVFPNPFSDKTLIEFTVQESGKAYLELYDIKGALVSKLFEGDVISGTQYQFTVDGSNLPDGIYVSVLTTNGEVMHERLVVAK